MAIGRLGLARRQQNRVLAFRGTLEALHLARHGSIDALAAKRIASACLALAEALRAQSRLADAEAGKLELSEADVMGWSDRVGRNHDRCDRILAALKLERSPDDIWDMLYRTPIAPPVAPLPPPAEIPPKAKPEASAGEPAPDASVGVPEPISEYANGAD